MPRTLQSRINTLQATKATLERNRIAKRETSYPQYQVFNSYLNAFAMNVMAQAYGLNNNLFHGYNGAYIYPYANSYINMYPPPSVMMPSYTPQIDAIKRAFIPQIPQTNYFHSQPFKNIIQNSYEVKESEPLDYPSPYISSPYISSPNISSPYISSPNISSPYISEAETVRSKYVKKLLHMPLKELAKKHDIVAKNISRSHKPSAPGNNDLNSLIEDLGEYNKTVNQVERTDKSETMGNQNGVVGYQQAADIREASLSTNTDGTSVFHYVVHTRPNKTHQAKKNLISKSSKNPVAILINALKSKIKFEKDLIKSFVNYVCDKNCLN